MDELLKWLSAGVDVNATDEFGNTPLHCAAASGEVRITEILLGTGKIDLSARDRKGRRSIDVARETIDIELKYGWDTSSTRAVVKLLEIYASHKKPPVWSPTPTP